MACAVMRAVCGPAAVTAISTNWPAIRRPAPCERPTLCATSALAPAVATTCDANGGNCHDEVTVNGGTTDPIDYVWSLARSFGSQAAQTAVDITDRALTAINNL